MPDPVRSRATIRRWKSDSPGGLAVADLPATVAAALGGLRQRRVAGMINGAPFTSNVMPAGAGVLCLSVSKAMLAVAGVAVGDEVDLEIGLA